MKLMIAWVMAVSLVLASASSGAAGEHESGLEVCGHLDEMEAARQALVEGDRKRALEYLRAARAILVECERQVDIASDPKPELEVGRDLI